LKNMVPASRVAACMHYAVKCGVAHSVAFFSEKMHAGKHAGYILAD